MMDMNFLEMFGTVVGLVYLWLEYRASIYLWILQSGAVCRLRYQYLLSDSGGLWMVFLDVGTKKRKKPGICRHGRK